MVLPKDHASVSTHFSQFISDLIYFSLLLTCCSVLDFLKCFCDLPVSLFYFSFLPMVCKSTSRSLKLLSYIVNHTDFHAFLLLKLCYPCITLTSITADMVLWGITNLKFKSFWVVFIRYEYKCLSGDKEKHQKTKLCPENGHE